MEELSGDLFLSANLGGDQLEDGIRKADWISLFLVEEGTHKWLCG